MIIISTKRISFVQLVITNKMIMMIFCDECIDDDDGDSNSFCGEAMMMMITMMIIIMSITIKVLW